MADKPSPGSPGVGPLSGMLDSMEFIRQAWGNFKLPRNLQPTMDLDEIDRRIADLKVVEQWLAVNLNMLRGSIQGMEVQRNTIAAFRSFGEAMTQTEPGKSETPSTASSPPPPMMPESLAGELSKTVSAAANPNAWWQLLQSQFAQLAEAALAGSKAAASTSSGATSKAPARAGPGRTGSTVRRGTQSASRKSVEGKPSNKTGKRKGQGR
jgi:hypothetical protein